VVKSGDQLVDGVRHGKRVARAGPLQHIAPGAEKKRASRGRPNDHFKASYGE
jgi:hypothetical protein